jgi:hypothetical protein
MSKARWPCATSYGRREARVQADRYVLGVDVGGTFTDLALIRLADGRAFYHKVSSTPKDPSVAVAGGIETLLEQSSVEPSQVQYFGHGTTVATNAVITGRTAGVVGDLLLGALAKAAPERVMAGCGSSQALVFSGYDPRRNRAGRLRR